MSTFVIDASGAVRATEAGEVIGWVTRTLRPGAHGLVLAWRARSRFQSERSVHPTRAGAAEDVVAVWRLHEAAVLAAAEETTTTSAVEEPVMTHLFTEDGHYSDPSKTLPQLIGELYGPGAYLQTDTGGGGVVYGPTVIDGEPVQLVSVVSYGEREGAGSGAA